CLNMKKYSKIMAGIVFLVCLKVIISRPIVITIVKEKTSWINIPVCLQSERKNQTGSFFFLLFSYLPQFVRNYK
ncbi:IS5/IS1182 family transposase, partial [Streptococcus agalactiae]